MESRDCKQSMVVVVCGQRRRPNHTLCRCRSCKPTRRREPGSYHGVVPLHPGRNPQLSRRSALANWYGKSRSNYFAVKDEGAFNALMALYEVEVIGNADGLVGFISKTEFGTIPTREHENSGEDPICILAEQIGRAHV